MKIIDARSGEVMTIGKRVEYPNGEYLELVEIDVDDERVLVRLGYRDFTKAPSPKPTGEMIEMIGDGEVVQSELYETIDMSTLPLIEDEQWVPLIVRRGDHPSFFGQYIGFIPS